LTECSACLHYVQDVNTILAVAQQLPSEVEPPARVWISIRQQLEQEGLLHEPATEEAVSRPAAPWWASFAELFRHRALATAAVAAMVLLVAVLLYRAPVKPVLQAQEDSFDPATVHVLSQQEHDLSNMQLASTGDVSAVDASLRQNLQQVDEFIADCEQHLREQPSDELSREYLTNAYQQKAALLSAMMDRGGSLN
jgi:anti-sigma-K factor RskA